MDLQIILDTYSCMACMVDYVNKSNRSIFNLHKELAELKE